MADHDFALRLVRALADRIYGFRAVRFNIGDNSIGTEMNLQPDAGNLAQVLNLQAAGGRGEGRAGHPPQSQSEVAAAGRRASRPSHLVAESSVTLDTCAGRGAGPAPFTNSAPEPRPHEMG